jgi:hypothetical protein
MVQHSVTVPLLGASWTKDQMVSGTLVDQRGRAVDPCAFYRRRNPAAACPRNPSLPVANAAQYISLGVQNVPDIVAVGRATHNVKLYINTLPPRDRTGQDLYPAGLRRP